MYCNQCGHEIVDGANFCKSCGQKINGTAPNQTLGKMKYNYPVFFVGLLIMLISMFFNWTTFFGKPIGNGIDRQFEFILLFFIVPFIQAVRGDKLNRIVLVVSSIIPALVAIWALWPNTGMFKPMAMDKGAYLYVIGFCITVISGWMRK